MANKITFKRIWSCGTRIPSTNDYVVAYKASNGFIIRGNAGRNIFSCKVIPSDWWTVYDPLGNEVFSDHLLSRCKTYVIDHA